MEQGVSMIGRALVVVVDDHGDEDHSGPLVTELLTEAGYVVDGVIAVAADEVEIRNALNTAVIVDNEPGFGEQLGDQRAAVVLVPVRSPIVNNNDKCPADQLCTLLHGCNRISGLRPRRGGSHHCWALPNVTWTFLVAPDGSL